LGCAGCASLAAPQAVRAETGIRISTSATAVATREPFTIIARITSVDSSVVPAGSVVFFVDGRPQGDAVTPQRLSPFESRAEVTILIREPGRYEITAIYKGTDGATLDSSSNTVDLEVGQTAEADISGGGNMERTPSPNDPLFSSHHAYVDPFYGVDYTGVPS
jgi:hypothetical protein